MFHFCQDELMAIMASLPFIPWLCMKCCTLCRSLCNRVFGRRHHCQHLDHSSHSEKE